jgi:CheY-like chemotaxis protein
LSEDGTEFFCPRIAGYPQDVADAWRRFPANGQLPIAEAVREGRSVLLGSLEQRRAYYPPNTQLPTMIGRALAAVPFRHGEVVGALGFTFPDDRTFGDDERAALEGTATLCAGALARVRRGGLGCEVLLVEDEPAVLRMLDFALRSHAFTVRRAARGEAAVEVYQRHRETIAVVLLDVQMPEMDGPQTLAALRAVDPEVRCVFMSGHTGRYTDEELRALGVAHVLQKPFSSLDQVIRVLCEVTRR